MSAARDRDLFDAVTMGYLVIESNRIDDWHRFLEGGVGMHVEDRTDAALRCRMDSYDCRILVKAGPAEDVAAIGYQLRDDQALASVEERLARHGVGATPGSGAEATARGVRSFVRFVGPKGLLVELFVEPILAREPLVMKASSFVTGDAGMGHVALTSKRPEAMSRFWRELFDARLSDTVEERIAGVTLDIEFLRLNRRHHSLAIAATRGLRLDPIRTKVQHFNVEVATLDDLTAAFLRCRSLGFEMAHEIGQHPNDRELSFYALSPSGFEVEVGWRPLSVDEATWEPARHTRISAWGHKPERASAVARLALNAGNFGRGARSYLRAEHAPFDGGEP